MLLTEALDNLDRDKGITVSTFRENDVKCAFLVDLSESLIEVIGKENTKLQRYSGEQGKLKPSLRTIINCYEKKLFRNEIQFDLEKILSCLVNTRVNIMHIMRIFC